MTFNDDHDYLVPLKDRIEQYNKQDREAITRGREEREKWLMKKNPVLNDSDHPKDQ